MQIPTSRADLQKMGATQIVHVSSEGDAPIWTELSIWWVDDLDRPFIPVVERCVDADGTTEVPAFKAQPFGSVGRALKWFEPSNLRDRLAEELPLDLEATYPDANTLRQRKAAENRGYSGPPSIFAALIWLYGPHTQEAALAAFVERDFNIPSIEVSKALMLVDPPVWGRAFIGALRYFDKKRWERERSNDT